jgi:hypothetical protein
LDAQKIYRVVVEMDSVRVVQAVQAKEFSTSNWGQLVKPCSRFFVNNADLQLIWVDRSCTPLPDNFSLTF